MRTKIVEVTNNNLNWGKFLLGDFDAVELSYRSKIDGNLLIRGRGWSAGHILVFDLQTGEGAWFLPGGLAKYDLDKHRIWVCPMYEPFLEYLYNWVREKKDPFSLPEVIDIKDAPFAMSGYRRNGPDGG